VACLSKCATYSCMFQVWRVDFVRLVHLVLASNFSEIMKIHHKEFIQLNLM
jgi:hypothetical protein